MSICPENRFSRAGHAQLRTVPGHGEHAAARLDAHRRIEQAAADAGGHRRAGARATGQRSPAPRSWTRRRMLLRSTTCMKPALTRRGKRACVSTSGPITPTGKASTSSTTCTACGEMATADTRPSAAGRRGHRVPAPTACPGLAGAKPGRRCRRAGRTARSGAAHVHGDLLVVAFVQHQDAGGDLGAQRVLVGQALFMHEAHAAAPLPQCSTSLPSALKMR